MGDDGRSRVRQTAARTPTAAATQATEAGRRDQPGRGILSVSLKGVGELVEREKSFNDLPAQSGMAKIPVFKLSSSSKLFIKFNNIDKLLNRPPMA